ncbi:MAG: ubiquitin-like protein Pup [Acidimicrobiia bacterium]
MAEQQKGQKAAPSKNVTAEEVSTSSAAETGEKIKAELDDLLDEIDDVLETNAEEFVKSYIQKGGQ